MDKNLKTELNSFLDQQKISQNEVANQIGVSKAAISQLLNNKYEGDTSKLETQIREWLDKKKQAVNRTIGFVSTNAYKRIYNALNECYQLPSIGLITGPAGIGKSHGVEQFAAEHPDAHIIHCDPKINTTAVVRSIAMSLGIKGFGLPNDYLKHMIKSKLGGTQTMFILDEANYLHPETIDTLRRLIVDMCKCSFCLVGVAQLMSNIYLNAFDFDQVGRRITVFLDLEGDKDHLLKKSETRGLVSQLFDDPPSEVVDFIHQKGRRTIGVIHEIVRVAYKVSQINKSQLTLEIVERACGNVFLTAHKR